MAHSSTSGWVPKALKFSTSLRVYFDQLESYFKFTPIVCDETKIEIFKAGLPAEEYERIVMGAELPVKFDVLKDAVSSRFDPTLPIQGQQEVFHSEGQRMGESVVLFLDRLRRLGRRAYPTLPDDARETLVDGQFRRSLRVPRLREVALISRETNLDCLATELARHEAIHWNAEPTQLPAAAVTETNDAQILKNLIESLADQVNQLKTTMAHHPRRGPARSRICWNCGGSGHFAYDCGMPAEECSKCGGQHLERFCRRQVSSVLTGLSGPRVTCVLGRVNDSPILVDSSSTPNLISELLWKQLGSPVISCESTTFMSANSSELRTLGTVQLCIRLGKSESNHTFYVVPSLTVDCLIGVDFLASSGCKLDYDLGVLSIPGHNIELIRQRPRHVSVGVIAEGCNLPAKSGRTIRIHSQTIGSPVNSLLCRGIAGLNPKTDSDVLIPSFVVCEDQKLLQVYNLSDKGITLKEGEPICAVEMIKTEQATVPEKNSDPKPRDTGTSEFRTCRDA